jgi:hypothetical protein
VEGEGATGWQRGARVEKTGAEGRGGARLPSADDDRVDIKDLLRLGSILCGESDMQARIVDFVVGCTRHADDAFVPENCAVDPPGRLPETLSEGRGLPLQEVDRLAWPERRLHWRLRTRAREGSAAK